MEIGGEGLWFSCCFSKWEVTPGNGLPKGRGLCDGGGRTLEPHFIKAQTRIYNLCRAPGLCRSEVALPRQHRQPGIACQSQGRARIGAH